MTTDWRCAESDMMRRRCDDDAMRASWLAGRHWPSRTRRGNNGRTGGKEAKETSGNSPSPHNLARPFVSR